MAVTDAPPAAAPAGGSFLLPGTQPAPTFTPEDFSEVHHQVRTTAQRFMREEVLPQVSQLEAKEPGLARKLIEQAGELGLLGVTVPERYDGLEMDLTTQMVVSECVGSYASFSTTYGAHAGIGTLPVVFFGTEVQKRTYLPRLVNAELLGAYCLSEAHAGSDSLAARTRATLASDGQHYTLNGQKMWISNGGWADLYTVFAKVDGERFTAFLVERAWKGVKPGAEERKMGLLGSSTTALYLDNVKVPAENVLGEVGRGPRDRFQRPQPRPPGARSILRGWGQVPDGRLGCLRPAAQGFRTAHRRVRGHPPEAGGHGGADIRRGVADLPHIRLDRRPLAGVLLGRPGRRRDRPCGPSRSTPSSAR